MAVIFRLILCVVAFRLLCSTPAMAQPEVFIVQATAMTSSMRGTEDIADDVCVWRNPQHPEQSVIIAINKSDAVDGGLYVFDLSGQPLQGNHWKQNTNWFASGRKLNNVDLCHGVVRGNESWDLVCASNRTDRTIDVFRVVVKQQQFSSLDLVGKIPIGDGFAPEDDAPYGIACASDSTLFISDKLGRVAQFELRQSLSGVGANRIFGLRHDNGGQPWQISESACPIEGIAVDSQHKAVYIAAEDEGIYRYDLKDHLIDIHTKCVVDRIGENLTADVEGLTIYREEDGRGYLLASSQGSGSFVAYSRNFEAGSANTLAGQFRIGSSATIDSVESTDGIDTVAGSFGPRFPKGLFIAHDGEGQSPTNYKIVPWERISKGLE